MPLNRAPLLEAEIERIEEWILAGALTRSRHSLGLCLAVKNIIGKRCDHAGMRWIKERVEAVVVQLRCIEANGDFDKFAAFVHDRLSAAAREGPLIPRLQSSAGWLGMAGVVVLFLGAALLTVEAQLSLEVNVAEMEFVAKLGS